VEAGIAVLGTPTKCPGINSFSVDPAELLGNQPSLISVGTIGPVTSILWSSSRCRGFPVGCPDKPPAGFTALDGGPDTNATTVHFTCGECIGQVTVAVTLISDQVSPDADAAMNVCEGAPFTHIEGLINCVGGSTPCWPGSSTPTYCCGACVDLTTDNANCGVCGNVCPTGVPCVDGGCGSRHAQGAAPDASQDAADAGL
jgi:hypothetical protein